MVKVQTTLVVSPPPGSRGISLGVKSRRNLWIELAPQGRYQFVLGDPNSAARCRLSSGGQH
jgi:hypothetical protein